MPKLPVYNSQQIIKKLEAENFILVGQKESHCIFRHKEKNIFITVPIHNKDLPKGTCYTILKQAGII